MGFHHTIRVVKHDEGVNHRSCTYDRVCWLMFLAFPLDFQKDLYIRAAVAPYGRLLEWFRDENKSRILVQCLLLNPDRVPRSLVVSRGTMIGGMGRSWSVPVYILDGHFPDVFPGDEDPVAFDGEPHPEHPPVVMGPNPQDPNWELEQQGAAGNLGMFGGNPHPVPPLELQQLQFQQAAGDVAMADAVNDGDQEEANEEVDEEFEADGWNPWEPAVFVGDNGLPAQQQQPQPGIQQDQLNLEHSGSSVSFVRGSGSDISLDMDEVLHDVVFDNGYFEPTAEEEADAFLQAVIRICATKSLLHRNSLPSGGIYAYPAYSGPPFVIAKETLALAKERSMPKIVHSVDDNMQMVLWKPSQQ